MDAVSSKDVAAQNVSRPKGHHVLAGLLALALLFRLAVIPLLGLHHPDELWQYLEPAHKLAFGLSVDAWEFRAGIRTWIIPVVLAPFMWLGDAIAPDSLWYVYLPKAVLALISLIIVYSWWKLGLQLSRTHAIAGAFVAAIWADLIYFGARPLSEPVSMALFFASVVVLSRENLSRNQLLLAGLLLGLTFSVRFQLAPALLCLILWTERRRFRETMPWIVLGGLAGLAVDGLIDLAIGEVPLNWIVENFRINLIEGKSSEYGRSPIWYYLLQPIKRWNAAFGAVIVLAAVGARRFPGLALVAVVNIAFHSLIPHKEFRFVLLSYEILVFLAAIGTADGINIARPHSRPKWIAVAGIGWVAMSLPVAIIQPTRGDWEGSRALLRTLQTAADTPRLCGLATYEMWRPLSVAYTFYHRDTPIYGFQHDDAAFRSHWDRFNVVIAHPARPPGGPFEVAACYRQTRKKLPYCVYRRPGGCSSKAAPDFEINRFVARHGV